MNEIEKLLIKLANSLDCDIVTNSNLHTNNPRFNNILFGMYIEPKYLTNEEIEKLRQKRNLSI